MSANARGSYNERFVASKLHRGKKVSERGKEGHDVESAPYVLRKPIWQWEAKYLKKLPLWLKDWQEQSLRQETPVIFRENHGDMWVMMPLSDLAPVDELGPEDFGPGTMLTAPPSVVVNGRKFVPE